MNQQNEVIDTFPRTKSLGRSAATRCLTPSATRCLTPSESGATLPSAFRGDTFPRRPFPLEVPLLRPERNRRRPFSAHRARLGARPERGPCRLRPETERLQEPRAEELTP